VQAPQCQIYW